MDRTQYHLEKNEVNIWFIKVDFDADQTKYYESILAVDENEKANRFKFEKDKIVYQTARGILRLLSGKYLNLNPKEIQFEYNEYGKPFYKANKPLKFNVSHSGERIVIAFILNHEIGVDIEKIKNDFDVLELAQNFFSATEIVALESQPKEELPKAFYRCWTRKEAFIKAEGSGLSFPLDKFAVTLDDDIEAELLETQWNPAEKNEWQLFSFIPAKGYLGALAVANTSAKISYHNWDTI